MFLSFEWKFTWYLFHFWWGFILLFFHCLKYNWLWNYFLLVYYYWMSCLNDLHLFNLRSILRIPLSSSKLLNEVNILFLIEIHIFIIIIGICKRLYSMSFDYYDINFDGNLKIQSHILISVMVIIIKIS